MPVETPARAEIRDRLDSARPTSWIEAIVASISWRRRISSIPSFGIRPTPPAFNGILKRLILDDQSKKRFEMPQSDTIMAAMRNSRGQADLEWHAEAYLVPPGWAAAGRHEDRRAGTGHGRPGAFG